MTAVDAPARRPSRNPDGRPRWPDYPADLIERRAALGLSQASLARAVGVHVNTVAGWESGRCGTAPEFTDAARAAIEAAERAELERLLTIHPGHARARGCPGF